jgi:hypothetical protein
MSLTLEHGLRCAQVNGCSIAGKPEADWTELMDSCDALMSVSATVLATISGKFEV